MDNIAKVSEISATSTVSFEDAAEDAIKKGIARRTDPAQHSERLVKEQQVRVDKGKITQYQVNLLITFVLE